MRFQDILFRNPVVTAADLRAHLGVAHSRNRRTQEKRIAYHVRKRHLLRVRRGLYLAVPPGSSPETLAADPYLLAAKMADDAVLAYHTALEVHGKAHSVFERFYFLTNRRTTPMAFRSYRFEGIVQPAALRAKHKEAFGVKTADRAGVPLRVTGFERTLVDVLDRPELGGGWEEIWQSLEAVEFFDVGTVVEYALLLDNATTAAKVGYFLDQHRETLMVKDEHLLPLKRRRPKQPHYVDRKERTVGRMVKEWNLIVPASVVERSWEEPV